MPQPRRPSREAEQPSATPAAAAAAPVVPAVVAATGAAAGGPLGGAVISLGAAALVKRLIDSFADFAKSRGDDVLLWVEDSAREQYPQTATAVLRAALDIERGYEAEFRRKALARLRRDLPAAAAISDPAARQEALRSILEREGRYLDMREEAMLSRVLNEIERSQVRALSPEGAYWKLSPYVKEHTLDCLAMAEKFWPWAVLDRIHPPLHPGCPCELLTLDDAVTRGLMGRDQIPNTRDAVRLAKRLMDDAAKAMAEGVTNEIVGEYLLALEEATARGAAEHGARVARKLLRWRKGFERGGEFRPQRGGSPGAKTGLTQRGLDRLHALVPDLPVPLTQSKRGRWTWIRGTYTFIPEAREWRKRVGGSLYTSPPGSTNVYRNGALVDEPGKPRLPEARKPPKPPQREASVEAEIEKRKAVRRSRYATRAAASVKSLNAAKPPIEIGDPAAAVMALRDTGFEIVDADPDGARMEFVHRGTDARLTVVFDGESVTSVTWTPDPQPTTRRVAADGVPTDWDSFRRDSLAWADELGKRFDARVQARDITEGTHMGDHAGSHEWSGVIRVGSDVRPDIERAGRKREAGESLTDDECRGVWSSNWVVGHEVAHSVNPISPQDFVDASNANLEEALAEECGIRLAVDRLRAQGQLDVLRWRQTHPAALSVAGVYREHRRSLGVLLSQAGLNDMDKRADFVFELKFNTPPGERLDKIAKLIADHDKSHTLDEWRDHVHLAMYHGEAQGGATLPFYPSSPGDKGGFDSWLSKLGFHLGDATSKLPHPFHHDKATIPVYVGGQGDEPDVQGPVPIYDHVRLRLGGIAGGSNGARWGFDSDGRRWLIKQYHGNTDQVATEALANAIYRTMGAAAAEAGIMHIDGRAALAYPVLDGKERKRIFHTEGPNEEVGRHFMVDALVANWDVAGLEDDNIMWDDQGHPFRVDQGGTFEMRAHGQPKPYGPVPVEVWGMMRKGQGKRSSKVDEDGMRQQGRDIAATLTPEKVDELVDAVPFDDEEMRERIRENLNARIAWMGRFGTGDENLPEPLSGDAARSELRDAQWKMWMRPEQYDALATLLDDPAVQEHLRSGKKKEQGTKEINAAIRDMDSLLRATSTPDEIYAFAGLRGADPSLVGLTLSDKRFLALTLNEQDTSTDPAVLRVLLPAKSRALFVRGVPDFKNEDSDPDLLLPRNAKMRVTGVRVVDGKRYVDATLLPPPEPTYPPYTPVGPYRAQGWHPAPTGPQPSSWLPKPKQTPGVNPRGGILVIVDGHVVPFSTWEQAADHVADSMGHKVVVKVRPSDSSMQERDITADEQAYLVSLATERVLARAPRSPGTGGRPAVPEPPRSPGTSKSPDTDELLWAEIDRAAEADELWDWPDSPKDLAEREVVPGEPLGDPFWGAGGCDAVAIAFKQIYPNMKIAALWYDDHGRRGLAHAVAYDPETGNAYDSYGVHHGSPADPTAGADDALDAYSDYTDLEREYDVDAATLAEHMDRRGWSPENDWGNDTIFDASHFIRRAFGRYTGEGDPPPRPPHSPGIVPRRKAEGGLVRDATRPDFTTIPDVNVNEPPLPTQGRVSTGMVVVEPDGRVWIYEPKGHFGGYEHTFPKGGIEGGLTGQQNAHRELFEETGLRARVTGFLGDYEGDTGVTRYYVAERIGGEPLPDDPTPYVPGSGRDAASVKLVTPQEAAGLLNRDRDKQVLADAVAAAPASPGTTGMNWFGQTVHLSGVRRRDEPPAPTMLLVTTGQPDMDRYASPALGRLLVPGMFDAARATEDDGVPFACDNGGFWGVPEDKYREMCDKMVEEGVHPLWVTVPDVLLHSWFVDGEQVWAASAAEAAEMRGVPVERVTLDEDTKPVGDWKRTADRFAPWQQYLAERGLPAALVAQDGLDTPEGLAWLDGQWDKIAAVFIGGSDDFKLGPGAAKIAQLAHEHGKLVHVGRVNSAERIAYARDILHADTVDGSSWAKFKAKRKDDDPANPTKLEKGTDFAARADAPPRESGREWIAAAWRALVTGTAWPRPPAPPAPLWPSGFFPESVMEAAASSVVYFQSVSDALYAVGLSDYWHLRVQPGAPGFSVACTDEQQPRWLVAMLGLDEPQLDGLTASWPDVLIADDDDAPDAIEEARWDPRLHPRDLLGRWRSVAFSRADAQRASAAHPHLPPIPHFYTPDKDALHENIARAKEMLDLAGKGDLEGVKKVPVHPKAKRLAEYQEQLVAILSGEKKTPETSHPAPPEPQKDEFEMAVEVKDAEAALGKFGIKVQDEPANARRITTEKWVKMLGEINAEAESLNKRWPGITNGVVIDRQMPDPGQNGVFDTQSFRIRIRPHVIDDAGYKNEYGRPWGISGDVRGCFRHEFGHWLDYSSKARCRDALKQTVFHDEDGNAINTAKWAKIHVSEYAGTMTSESIAEMFAMYGDPHYDHSLPDRVEQIIEALATGGDLPEPEIAEIPGGHIL